MKVLLIGSGGREHALAKYIIKNKKIEKLYVAPGNGGTDEIAENINISPMEFDKIISFVEKNKIDFVIVAPDNPLADGLVDLLHEINIPCFGPIKAAAKLEGSKVYAKNFMKKYNIPTADFAVFNNADKAKKYLEEIIYPTVIKADGLALGKGVYICADYKEAINAINDIMQEKIFGDSGKQILIEKCLIGPEVSVLCFTDGKTIKPMISSMDHKRALDDDKGLNTGGMGVIAPNPYYTKDIEEICINNIFLPTIKGMQKEGAPFKGCLYFGLMITENGPMVIEYNARFGDPETQGVLPLLKSDLFEIMLACEEERLEETPVDFSNKFSCNIVLASGGYPGKYEKGKEIDFSDFKESDNVKLFHAGTKLENGKFYTSGGRVLGICAIDETLEKAISKAYKSIEKITFENCYMRNDIGKKAMQRGSK